MLSKVLEIQLRFENALKTEFHKFRAFNSNSWYVTLIAPASFLIFILFGVLIVMSVIAPNILPPLTQVLKGKIAYNLKWFNTLFLFAFWFVLYILSTMFSSQEEIPFKWEFPRLFSWFTFFWAIRYFLQMYQNNKFLYSTSIIFDAVSYYYLLKSVLAVEQLPALNTKSPNRLKRRIKDANIFFCKSSLLISIFIFFYEMFSYHILRKGLHFEEFPTYFIFLFATVHIFIHLEKIPSLQENKNKLKIRILKLSILLSIAYGFFQFLTPTGMFEDLSKYIIPLDKNIFKYAHSWAFLFKIPYFSIIIVLLLEWKKRLRKTHTTYIDGISNLNAGVILLLKNEKEFYVLCLNNSAANLLFSPDDSRRIEVQSNSTSSLTAPAVPFSEINYISELAKNNLKDFAFKKKVSQFVINLRKGPVIVNAAPMQEWERRYTLFLENFIPLRNFDVSTLINMDVRILLFVHESISNEIIDEFSELSKMPVMKQADIFHQISKPIDLVGTILNEVRRNNAIMNSLEDREKLNFQFLSKVIIDILSPQIRFLAFLKKREYDDIESEISYTIKKEKIDIITELIDNIRDLQNMVLSLKNSDSFYSILKLPNSALKLLEEDKIHMKKFDTDSWTIFNSKEVFRSMIFEIMLNAMKNLPKDITEPRYKKFYKKNYPIMIDIKRSDENSITIIFSNIFKTKSILNLPRFREKINRKPIGGFYSIRRFAKTLNFEFDFEIYNVYREENIYKFKLFLKNIRSEKSEE